MTIAELITKEGTPDPTFTGILTADDWVTAINTDPTNASPTEDNAYCVLQEGLTGAPASTNPETKERKFIRGGKQTIKTGSQLTISLAGTHYVGDDALDYILSDDIVFGTGKTVITDFIHFNKRNGLGVKGKCTITVDSFAGGNAGDDSTFSATLSQSESVPVSWTYSAS